MHKSPHNEGFFFSSFLVIGKISIEPRDKKWIRILKKFDMRINTPILFIIDNYYHNFSYISGEKIWIFCMNMAYF